MKIMQLDTTREKEIKDIFAISSLCAKVLASKNISNEEIEELLASPMLSDPFQASGVKEAIDRIHLAKQRNEKVIVCGDYDVDGICATTILVDTLRRYGITCGYYIPNRFKEGYGLHAHTVALAKEKGYSLIITVDNGVKAFEALDKVKELGMDIILTDHHAIDEIPYCDILVHPSKMDEQFSTLCGAGIALLLSNALLGEIKEHVVLACVASIGDVMIVKKETRNIIKLGIQYLQKGICLPIIQLNNNKSIKWDEVEIAFQVVPKLNAIGRMADRANVNTIVTYLMSHDPVLIEKGARSISNLNNVRKELSEKMVDKATTLIHEEYPFQLLFDDSFHEGLSGIVAGKLSEKYQCPIMIASKNHESFKGSIRSAGVVDLTTFFNECDFLEAYGGHQKAAGIQFPISCKQDLQDYVNGKMKLFDPHIQKIYEVIQIHRNEISIPQVQSLDILKPFGEGFKEPMFYFDHLKVQKSIGLKNGIHSKWQIDDEMEALMFFNDAYKDTLHTNRVSMIGNLRINQFFGRKKVNISVVEIVS